jgi:hypothetical protein
MDFKSAEVPATKVGINSKTGISTNIFNQIPGGAGFFNSNNPSGTVKKHSGSH